MNTLQQQVAIALSLTIVTRNNGRSEYFTFPLFFATKPFLILWQLWPIALKAIQSVIIWYKLVQIGFNSLAFAMQKTYAENPCRILGGAI